MNNAIPKKIKFNLYYPFSVPDLFFASESRCNVFTYPELNDFDHIDELYTQYNSNQEKNAFKFIPGISKLPFTDRSCIILYMSKPGFGHWTVINRIPDGDNKYSYQFLDSYGEIPDDQLEYIPEKFREDTNQVYYTLTKLINDSGEDLFYNDIALQVLDNRIATCGYYCSIFVKYNQIPVEDFVDIIIEKSAEYKIFPDELIGLMAIGPEVMDGN